MKLKRRYPKKQWPVFGTLPRRLRREAVVCLKGKIQRTAAEYGPLFTSHLVLDEPGRPDLYNQWFDIYFPGKDRYTIWNATVITAKNAFWDEVRDLGYERTAALLTPEDHKRIAPVEFEPAQRSHTGKVLTYKWIEKEGVRFDNLGGLTFSEHWEKMESEIARNEPPTVHEEFRIVAGYEYGVGLRIVIDADAIQRATLETAVRRFQEAGETNWRSPTPIPNDRLPSMSQKEALAQVEYPSVLLGRRVIV